MQAIKVALFEDNKHLRESLSILISGTPGFQLTGAYPDCDELLYQLNKELPDVVLMDIEMPGMRGTEAVKLIKKDFPEVQVLMQTVFQDDENIFQSICAGASGYILKTTSPAQYLEAIRDVHQGGSPMSPFIARRVVSLFAQNVSVPSLHNYQLTPKEKEVLSLMVQGKSIKMIADASDISYETVRTHVKNIYSKLHVNCNTEAVSKAMREKIV
ncbi:MAG: response regulator transcription factor [Chitinophagales bacterium]|nr:response regulator transcription factor [Bacteroidota bacterium]MBX7142540.1 response regulator transcription factor [Chitinophagales bacterium]